jgi:hypothetical protein
MDIDEALYSIARGYCLWVGAGLTVQLAGGPKQAPDWEGVTQQVEDLAGVPHLNLPNPKRLQACSTALGEKVFRSFLRKVIGPDDLLLTNRSAELLHTGTGVYERAEYAGGKT